LADKARNAYFALKSKLFYSENLSVKSWLKLYNSIVVPIMTYGSEIWISEFKPNFETLDKTAFEKTQNMILKNVLGVHGKSSNIATRCELGTFPISIKCYKLMFKYYIRLCRIGKQSGGPHNLLRAAFTEDAKLTNKENSWSSKLLEISKVIGLTISNNNISASIFIQKLEDFYKNKIKLQLQKVKEKNTGKLLFYSKIFNDFEMQKYL